MLAAHLLVGKPHDKQMKSGSLTPTVLLQHGLHCQIKAQQENLRMTSLDAHDVTWQEGKDLQ